MSSTQKRYPTGEQELLSIVETLKEFKNILLGQKIIIHTDHKNLLYEKSASDRIIRWRLLVEEYAPTFEHVKGTHNVVADALSRLDADYDVKVPDKPSTYEQARAYASVNEVAEYEYPLSGKVIAKYQKLDKTLIKNSIGSSRRKFSLMKVENEDVLTYNGKICIPTALQTRVVDWYHTYLRHPGETRTEETLRRTLIWPTLRQDVRAHCKTCRECQLAKKVRKKYGQLPLKESYSLTPWERVDVDLIGPYTIRNENGKEYALQAMTMIDPATRWFEVVQIKNKSALSAMNAFDNNWLCRYPRPFYIGFDNGGEFKNVFSELCSNFGLTPKPSTEYNPQSNAMIERIHLTLGNMLRTFELESKDLDEENPFEEILAAVAWALRSTYHTVLDATPGQLVFGRDMLLPIQYKANWAAIALRRKEQIKRDNIRENKTRLPHQYTVGQKVLLTKPGIIPKMSLPRKGPYTIVRIHSNGTVRIQRGPVESRVNIRRLTPYYDRPNPGGV
jgi:cleavage and polyadenylation specificity factor subunit 1